MENSYPFLSDNVLSSERTTLIENDKIINNDNETANIMIFLIIPTFYFNIGINFNVHKYHDCEGISGNVSDPILKAIVKYRNHPDIKAIKKASNSNNLFSFDIVDGEKIVKEVSSLDRTKACKESDIHKKIIKENADIFSEVLHLSRLMLQSMKEPFDQFSNWLLFPQFFKKGSSNSKDNYRPTSILKNLSKVFENIMYKQMATFMDKHSSKFQCDLEKTIAHSNVSLHWLENGKVQLIVENLLELC